MVRQVGPLELNDRGVAVRGVLVRHLMMPGDLAHSRQVVQAVARIAPAAAINIMGQYHPAHEAGRFNELLDRPDVLEVHSLRRYAEKLGLVDVSG